MPLQLYDTPQFLDLRIPASNHPRFLVGNMGGKRMLVHFSPYPLTSPEGQAWAQAFMQVADPWNPAHGVCSAFVTGDAFDCQIPQQAWSNSPTVFFFDAQREMTRVFEVPLVNGQPQPISYLLNNRSQVVAVIRQNTLQEHLSALAAVVPRLSPILTVTAPAPVLILPKVFDDGFCDELINYYETTGGTPSGYMVEINGKTVSELDPGRKQRKDCTLEDDTLKRRVGELVKRRVIPEVEKVFQYQITRMERYLVARYDEGAGYFRAHRDNTTAGTAHRRFAMSVHLNDDYEGGGVAFPEFGDTPYKTGKGGAVVFSCSLMHEALPVTKGIRYVFLPFFYAETEAELREKNNHLLGEGVAPYVRSGSQAPNIASAPHELKRPPAMAGKSASGGGKKSKKR
jgi:hypothetical protein